MLALLAESRNGRLSRSQDFQRRENGSVGIHDTKQIIVTLFQQYKPRKSTSCAVM
jgi:hypothetical protein